ncbi:unnamed protein product [Leptidea sinapis]|uniref:Uncharacterized protein n=1 Tax=Leptidea sinapis TaxID=189913 RepID=A0A5E4PS75_9NEOP|nr:unnamed protein product [Leptidea sinapis]
MLEAREAGKFAIIKYNKLIVKNNVDNRQEKRKIQPSSPLRTPPNNNLNINKNITLISQTAKQLKANRFNGIPSTSTTRKFYQQLYKDDNPIKFTKDDGNKTVQNVPPIMKQELDD